MALREAYRRDLQHLHDQVLIMGSMVDKAVDRSIGALARLDFAAAREVVDQEERSSTGRASRSRSRRSG